MKAKKDIHESHVDFLRKCRDAALYAGQYWSWTRIECSEKGNPKSVEDIAQTVLRTALEVLKR